MADHRDRWRVHPGKRIDIAQADPASTAEAPGNKTATLAAAASLLEELAEMQNRLWAEHQRSLLLVLQAIDAGGKDGTIRKVFTGVNPQGVRVASFKAPTLEELAHDFLWRIHAQAPSRGEIGVFNRSHYEDVLITRVDKLVPEPVWRARYGTIRDFEAHLGASGTTIVKVFLHISKDEQKERFQARLDDPSKRWKFAAADLDVRKKWDAYQRAFSDAINETTTKAAPWYVVPADKKWYRDWVVLHLLVETLREMAPDYPPEPPGLSGIVIDS